MKRIDHSNFIATVYKKHYKEIYTFFVIRLNYDVEFAKDLTQEVFLKIWQKRHVYDSKKSNVRTWLYVVARNHLIDNLRKKKHEITIDDIDKIVSGSRDKEMKKVEDAELMKIILGKLRLMSKKDRELVQLRYIHEFSNKEISEMLNKRRSNIKVSIHRALKKLKILVNENDRTKNN